MRAVTAAAGGALVFEKLFERAGDPAVRVWANGAVRLASGEVVDLTTGNRVVAGASEPGEVVKCLSGWLVVTNLATGTIFRTRFRELQRLSAAWVQRYSHQASLPRRRAPVRHYRSGDGRTRMSRSRRPVITIGRRWPIMVKSTTWLDDVAVQDALGAAFVVLPHGDGGVHQIRVPELDGAKIVAGKAGGRFAAFSVLTPALIERSN
jgi:hypothetical protein